MKHNFKITLLLILVFLITQVFGIFTVSNYINVQTEIVDDVEITTITHEKTFIGEPAQIEEEQKTFSFLPIAIIIGVGTLILLGIIKFKLIKIWKFWFGLSIFITVAVSLGVYLDYVIAGILALILVFGKLYRPNIILHNLTEILIYTGIAIILMPLLNLISAIIILLLISLYDMFAVWKSKHMVKMAKFQLDSKLFAGLSFPYSGNKIINPKNVTNKKTKSSKKAKIAVLGGGDIAFPLIFSVAVLEYLILNKGLTVSIAILNSFLITIFATIALGFLLFFSKKDRFYPAMPFISAGCFLGLGMVFLINMI